MPDGCWLATPPQARHAEGERDGWPVVGIVRSDALLGLFAPVFVVSDGLPVDWHDLEGGEQQRRVHAALAGSNTSQAR
jgi:hypothetical protein